MKIKELFGYCGCKGCKNKSIGKFIISGFDRKHKPIKKSTKICEKHAKELFSGVEK